MIHLLTSFSRVLQYKGVLYPLLFGDGNPYYSLEKGRGGRFHFRFKVGEVEIFLTLICL